MAFYKGIEDKNRASRGDLEFIFVPMKTPRVIMTDRADGSLWLLTFSVVPPAADGLGYISIVQPVPSTPDPNNLHVYGPNDGPMVRWVDTPVEHSQGVDPKPTVYARLLIRGGYLGFETIQFNVSGGRVMARKDVQRVNREIIRPTTYQDSGPFNVLAWRDMEF